MPKDIKRCYHFLDLPYDATVEDVRSRQKVKIKMLRAQAIRKGISNKKKINEVAIIGEELIDFIEREGVQPPEKVLFDTKPNEIFTQLAILFIVATVCVISFVALL